MAIVLKDRVKETTSVTGTGTVTLLGAAPGYQAFSAIGNGNITYYAIVNSEDGTWEVGTGTYSTTGPTLTRTTVFESSNSGALVDFGVGVKDVFVTYPAERAIYEEPSGNTLIDGGPLTVVGQGVTGYTSFSAVLAELYGDIDSFAQLYAQNLNDGSSASADLVAYNDLGDGLTNFVDVGINSSNYSSLDYPIFTPGSSYVFNDGGEMFVGSATDDLVLFAGGVDTTDEAVRINKTTKNVTTVADVDVGGDVNATGGTFTAPVTTSSSMVSPGTTELVTKAYVDQATSTGLHLHQPVLVATTGNLTATYSNGTAGVGATLTNSGAQAALSIDGVSVSVADRVLVWQQSAQAQNGIYVVTTVGSGATNWVLTRASDADTYVPQSDTGLGGGDYFYVQSGSTGQGDSYVCTNDGTITFGTTAITFAQFSGAITYTGGTNIDITGQVISLAGTVAATNGGTGNNTVTTGDLLYGSGTNTWGQLAAGAGYKSLVMNAGGTLPEWNAIALNQSGAVSGALGATNGGTGQSSYSVGDVLYSGVTDTLSKLAGNTTTTKKFLAQTGTGSASAAPVWSTISGADVTSDVSAATNLAGGAANQIPYQTGSGTTAFIAAPTTAGTSLAWNGSSLAWEASGASFDPGTAMIFKQTAAPTGWTKATTTTLNDSALRVVTGTAATGGSVAFTTAFASRTPAGTVGSTTATNIATSAGGTVGISGAVTATTLAESQMPSHRHAINNNAANGNIGQGQVSNPSGHGNSSYWNFSAPSQQTSYVGGSGAHNHGFNANTSFTGTSHNHTQDAHTHTFTGTAMDFAVKYVDVIIATKD